MREKLYKIFDLGNSESIGLFCFCTFIASMFVIAFGCHKSESIITLIGFLFFTPTLFFIIWFILAIIVLFIEKLIIAPIEFVVYELGIPKIKINVDVIWKYQQKELKCKKK